MLGKGDGVALPDSDKAVHYYLLDADQQHSDAQFLLALCYAHGNGVAKNEPETLKYFGLSADQGNVNAYGIGVDKDQARVVELFRIAAEHGNIKAIFQLGVCYEHGRGVRKTPVQAIMVQKKRG